MQDFTQGRFTYHLWQEVQPVVNRIKQLDFLRELATGQLDASRFVFYLLQDDMYLHAYARTLALLGAKAENNAETRFWIEAAITAIEAEKDMHGALLADKRLQVATKKLGKTAPTPDCLAYVSYLKAVAALEPYAVGVAGALPCFWIYAEVGQHLLAMAGNLSSGHPYKAWIKTYDDASFAEATYHAVSILEHCLQRADEGMRKRMRDVFMQACHYEERFWHSAYIQQDWHLPIEASRKRP